MLTYVPDAWIDEKKTLIGYEISFAKYFYKDTFSRSIDEIVNELNSIENATDGMLADILGGMPYGL